MKVSVFGLGYVGCVSLGCLAQSGHDVIGVDVNEHKVNLINQGKPTIIEKDIDQLILAGFNAGEISATTDYIKAVAQTDISLICVGTPSSNEGHLDLEQIYKVAHQIAKGIKEKKSFHVIVIRSTVLPGTNYKIRKIVKEQSGKKENIDFAVVSNPEFLREGSAVSDFYNPAITVIGTDNQKALYMMKELYKDVKAPIEVTDIKVAEIIKYVNNSYHALKISFANEVGNICKKLNIDSHKVMDLFCKDTHLNISPTYFKPGYAYGGSCLPKDLKALKALAHDYYLNSPVIESIERSNENQKKIAIEIIESKGRKSIGLVGLSFKAGTDDLRYSPSVELAEYFLGKGYSLNIYDKNVSLSNLTGTNKQFIQEHIPHLSKLLVNNLEELFQKSEIIVITQKNEELISLIDKNEDKFIVDLIRIKDNIDLINYEGICW
ncbi:MAG: nucleotide sugar dehydrogenase [Candidatus Helarchaeota archaeon]